MHQGRGDIYDLDNVTKLRSHVDHKIDYKRHMSKHQQKLKKQDNNKKKRSHSDKPSQSLSPTMSKSTDTYRILKWHQPKAKMKEQ